MLVLGLITGFFIVGLFFSMLSWTPKGQGK